MKGNFQMKKYRRNTHDKDGNCKFKNNKEVTLKVKDIKCCIHLFHPIYFSTTKEIIETHWKYNDLGLFVWSEEEIKEGLKELVALDVVEEIEVEE